MTGTANNAMIGHDAAASAFAAAWASGRLHHAWLLCGPAQMGKAHFARRLARFLLTRPDGSVGRDAQDVGAAAMIDSPGERATQALYDAGTHPELVSVQRDPKKLAGGKLGELARNITVDQIRAVNAHMHGTIVIGHWRVVLVDAVDDLEPNAANALLKTLEEPPRQTIFLLVSHQPGRLLPTIRSRCRILRFQTLDDGAMMGWLHGLRPLAEPALLASIARASGGVPGLALRMLDGDIAALEERLRAIAARGDHDGKLRSALAHDLGKAAARDQFDLLLEMAPRLLARLTREQQGEGQAALLDQWAAVQQLTREAVRGSFNPGAIAFAISGCFAASSARAS